jgi:hypothetical protein
MHRQGHLKPGALALFGNHLDLAPEQFGEFFANRQAQAGPRHRIVGRMRLNS